MMIALLALLHLVVLSAQQPVNPHEGSSKPPDTRAKALHTVDWSIDRHLLYPRGVTFYTNSIEPVRLPALADVDKFTLEELVTMSPAQERKKASTHFQLLFAHHRDVKRTLQPLVDVEPDKIDVPALYTACLSLRADSSRARKGWINRKTGAAIESYLRNRRVPEDAISTIMLASTAFYRRENSRLPRQIRRTRDKSERDPAFVTRRFLQCRAARDRHRARKRLEKVHGAPVIPAELLFDEQGRKLSVEVLEARTSGLFEDKFACSLTFHNALASVMLRSGYSQIEVDAVVGRRCRVRAKERGAVFRKRRSAARRGAGASLFSLGGQSSSSKTPAGRPRTATGQYLKGTRSEPPTYLEVPYDPDWWRAESM